MCKPCPNVYPSHLRLAGNDASGVVVPRPPAAVGALHSFAELTR